MMNRWYYQYPEGICRGMEIETLNMMKIFYAKPSIEVFNRIIELDGDLYIEVNDPTDELYITDIYGESVGSRQKRQETAKEALKTYKPFKTRLCNPAILSWVWAAVKQFPWFLEDCSRPMYIERAHNFTNSSFCDLVHVIAVGPIIDSKLLDAMDKNTYANNAYKIALRLFVELSFVKYCASGNRWYIDHAKELASSHKPLISTLQSPTMFEQVFKDVSAKFAVD